MKGKISAGIFKAMAVASALAIGGGYVAWRQAEADKSQKREQAKAKEDLELMVGSKNPGRPLIGKEMTRDEIDGHLEQGRDFIQPIPGIPEGAEDVVNEAPLLPGSKSISMPLFTKEQLERMREEEKKEKQLKLLPGSKSIDSILKAPEREKSE